MNLEKQLEQGGLPRTFLLRLYEKWFRATPQPQTRSVYEARWAKKWRFGSSENYAAGASETFHTVSEGVFSEVHQEHASLWHGQTTRRPGAAQDLARELADLVAQLTSLK